MSAAGVELTTGLRVKLPEAPKQMVVSLGSCTLKLETVNTGTIVSTTIQQVSGLSTDKKSVSLFVAVTVAPVAPFDHTKEGFAIDGTLAVMMEEAQEEFWLKVTLAVQGET